VAYFPDDDRQLSGLFPSRGLPVSRQTVAVNSCSESFGAAFDAFRKYSNGRSNPAQLNIVDCVVYALARSRNLPLLFTGRDFSHTDIRSAVPFAV
jgi:uncharacterized protein with PIN domain